MEQFDVTSSILTSEVFFVLAKQNLHFSFLTRIFHNFLILIVNKKRLTRNVLMIIQVKVKRWEDGVEKDAIGGLTADFGSVLPAHAKDGQRFSAAYADPLNGCSLSSSNVGF